MSLSEQLTLDFLQTDSTTVESAEPIVTLPVVPVSPAAPLEYTLKVSARARQVIMRVEQGRGLLVTIPRRYPKRSIPELVESQRAWIEKALSDIAQKTPEQYRVWPPRLLSLHAVGKEIAVRYESPDKASTATTARWVAPNELLLCVDSNDKVQVATCLAAVLKKTARELLEPQLQQFSRQTGLCYKRLSIRGQRSLWGSYSSSGTLSLNYKLLFLSSDLVDYVMLHELAHTRHLDHSEAFWSLLRTLKDGAMTLDQQLNTAGPMVPPWLELAKG